MECMVSDYVQQLLRAGWTQDAANRLVAKFMQIGDMDGLKDAVISAKYAHIKETGESQNG